MTKDLPVEDGVRRVLRSIGFRHRMTGNHTTMKRTLLAALAIATATAALPATASATDTPPVDTDCWVSFNFGGPSRITHGTPAAITGNVYTGNNCDEVAGICVTVINLPSGPSRATHSRPAQSDPCVPLGEACAITYDYGDHFGGPARAVHQPSRPAATQPTGDVVDIPPACESLLVLAQTPTGADTWPTVWIATALLGAGAVLIIAPRRLARR